MLHFTVIDSFGGLFYLANLLITICIINYWIVIPGGVLIIVLLKLFVWIKPIMINIKKLDLVFKSPVYSYFTSTLYGIVHIRVYGQ